MQNQFGMQTQIKLKHAQTNRHKPQTEQLHNIRNQQCTSEHNNKHTHNHKTPHIHNTEKNTNNKTQLMHTLQRNTHYKQKQKQLHNQIAQDINEKQHKHEYKTQHNKHTKQTHT